MKKHKKMWIHVSLWELFDVMNTHSHKLESCLKPVICLTTNVVRGHLITYIANYIWASFSNYCPLSMFNPCPPLHFLLLTGSKRVSVCYAEIYSSKILHCLLCSRNTSVFKYLAACRTLSFIFLTIIPPWICPKRLWVIELLPSQHHTGSRT